MMAKDECFALKENGECTALAVFRCIGYKRCAFYKTRKQHKKDIEKYGDGKGYARRGE